MVVPEYGKQVGCGGSCGGADEILGGKLGKVGPVVVVVEQYGCLFAWLIVLSLAAGPAA